VRLFGMLLIWPVAILGAQQRFGNDYPQLKGFTKSPVEHILNEYEGILEIREVRGSVVEASSGGAIPEAVFELRSENPDDHVREVKTKPDGSFYLHSVRDGIYVFKVTKYGFQSVFGKIRVSSKASKGNFKIELRMGV
jgi:hypothetical protein